MFGKIPSKSDMDNLLNKIEETSNIIKENQLGKHTSSIPSDDNDDDNEKKRDDPEKKKRR
jgi:hypothetical protein